MFLPGFRTKRNAWHLLIRAFAAVWSGERFSSHTTAVQVRNVNGLSGYEAAEMSSRTLLR